MSLNVDLGALRRKYLEASPATVLTADLSEPAQPFSQWAESKEAERMEFFFGSENPYSTPRLGHMSNRLELPQRALLGFSGYNYLGLNGHPRVNAAVAECAGIHGTSASASRVAGGECRIHVELEEALAGFLGVEDTVVTVGGYQANLATLSYLMGEQDLILHDEFSHHSLVEGARISGARRIPFRHNDYDHLEQLLRSHRSTHRRVLIVVESLYSMDGDIADLPRLVEIKRRHSAYLMVDEAHSIGVLGEHGKGLCEHFDVDPTAVDILMGTLSKSLASCGGFIGGSRGLTRMLRFQAPGFMLYSAGIPPTAAAAALAALKLLEQEPHRVRKLQENARWFRVEAVRLGLRTAGQEEAPVCPVLLDGWAENMEQVAWITRELFHRHVHVLGMGHPVVPRGRARLRFFITSEHRNKEITRALEQTAQILRTPRGRA